MRTEPWTLVLAAGAGRRLASVTGGVPKQYWRPDGAPSLLEQTIKRLRPLSVPERTVTVVDETHHPYVQDARPEWPLGEIVYQPADRGTATGVALGLGVIAAADPSAVVTITPSDHGVEDVACFRRGLTRALSRVGAGRSSIVLFGAEAEAPSTDLGWITPETHGLETRNTFHRVTAFVEKPPRPHAMELLAAGAVWNTMVLVGKVGALLELYRAHLPFHLDVVTAAHAMAPPARQSFLRDWYDELSAADFCRDLLTRARNLCLYTWPAEMGWSDLGTPDRLQNWLELQREPALSAP